MALHPPHFNFNPSGLGAEFSVLNPGIGQVFYIGDGKTTAGIFKPSLHLSAQPA